jgi:hypothetical protein
VPDPEVEAVKKMDPVGIERHANPQQDKLRKTAALGPVAIYFKA